MAECSVVGRVLRCPEHVALHEVVVAAELVQVHVRGSDHPDVAAGEPAAQDEGDLLQAPAEPLGSVRLKSHLLLEALRRQRKHTMESNQRYKTPGARELPVVVCRPIF